MLATIGYRKESNQVVKRVKGEYELLVGVLRLGISMRDLPVDMRRPSPCDIRGELQRACNIPHKREHAAMLLIRDGTLFVTVLVQLTTARTSILSESLRPIAEFSGC